MSIDETARPVVLVVDDATETLSLLTDILENNGMTALVARSGAAALNLIKRVVPDLVLLDAVMPEMDGFETCRRIKADRTSAHLPIIFMTGLTDTESVVRGFRSGGVDYITKPIIPDEMIARMLGHLATARLAQSARLALDASGASLIAFDGQMNILWMTPASLKLLGSDPQGKPQDGPLLSAAVPALHRLVEQRTGRVSIPAEAGALVATFAGEAAPGEFLIRIGVDAAVDDVELFRSRFELTGREAEVLLWLSRGKSNRDIAEVLTCSPRTINKHLEQIYGKLGVENRTAAAMLAAQTLGARFQGP